MTDTVEEAVRAGALCDDDEDTGGDTVDDVEAGSLLPCWLGMM